MKVGVPSLMKDKSWRKDSLLDPRRKMGSLCDSLQTHNFSDSKESGDIIQPTDESKEKEKLSQKQNFDYA